MSYTVQERLKQRKLARLNKGNVKSSNKLKKGQTIQLDKKFSNI